MSKNLISKARVLIVDTPPTLGESLKTLRLRAGLSQSQLAKRAKVSRNQIVAMENDKANMTLSILVRVSEALGCVVDISVNAKQ